MPSHLTIYNIYATYTYIYIYIYCICRNCARENMIIIQASKHETKKLTYYDTLYLYLCLFFSLSFLAQHKNEN